MLKTVGILPAMLLVLAMTEQPQQTSAKPPDTSQETLLANELALLAAGAKAGRVAISSLVLPEGVWANSTGFIPMNLLVNGLDGFQITKWDMVNPHVTRLEQTPAT